MPVQHLHRVWNVARNYGVGDRLVLSADIAPFNGAETEVAVTIGAIEKFFVEVDQPSRAARHNQSRVKRSLDIVYFVTRAAWPHLVTRGGGAIISTSSIAAVRGCVAPQSAHGAAKAAVASLMNSLVIEGAPHNIRANTISPGPITHPLTQSALEDPNHPMSKLVAKIPMGRMGRPEEVAYLALFLASDESPFITGANILIDGGLTTWV
jgi:NAD(P)-dependent dehydrogenase (short-subunit alcohol dehydrogenase family)